MPTVSKDVELSGFRPIDRIQLAVVPIQDSRIPFAAVHFGYIVFNNWRQILARRAIR